MFNLLRARNKRNRLKKEAYELLLQLQVYPFGIKEEDWPKKATQSDYEFVKFITSRPRVQVSANADLAKKVLRWQREAYLKNGDRSKTKFPSTRYKKAYNGSSKYSNLNS